MNRFLSLTRYTAVMNSWVIRALRAIPAAAIFLALAIPPTGSAQPLPSYARPTGETIKGTISRFDGPTNMYVRDVRGYIDHVTLRQGTVINPTGIRLQPGFSVTVTGYNHGSTFVADEIDTPYHYYGYAYPYYYPYYYPYPAYGLSLGFGWGWGRWGWR
jgi:hypothetical protein